MNTTSNISHNLKELVSRLVRYAFAELANINIQIHWRKIGSLADVKWRKIESGIRIRVNAQVMNWHEAAVFGLLSHELSHTIQRNGGFKECETDKEVIERGLGVYLALERIFAGRYYDDIIRGKQDKYLGYSTIRQKLSKHEVKELDTLLMDSRLIPKPERNGAFNLVHDTVIIEKQNYRQMLIDGHLVRIPLDSPDEDVRILIRDDVTYVYVNEVVVTSFKSRNNV